MHRVGVEAATELCEALRAGGVERFHFYTLNRSTATREIYDEPRPRRLNRLTRNRAPHDRGARTRTQWRREWDLNPR